MLVICVNAMSTPCICIDLHTPKYMSVITSSKMGKIFWDLRKRKKEERGDLKEIKFVSIFL